MKQMYRTALRLLSTAASLAFVCAPGGARAENVVYAASEASAIEGEALLNKRLSGDVTAYVRGDSITICTDKGYEFTFAIDAGTRVYYGAYTLGSGSRVRIVYDGYAKDSPTAKKIDVYSDCDPTLVTMDGFVRRLSASAVTLDAVDFMHAEETTDAEEPIDPALTAFVIQATTVVEDDVELGAPVRITYYTDQSGYNIAVEVALRSR